MHIVRSKPPSAQRRVASNNCEMPNPRFEIIPINRIEPTTDNRRRKITQASIESLATSIKNDGVLQPVVVRPHPTRSGHYELRAGERRWRAARLAGLKEIPAIVSTFDDVAALSATISENMERLDLHPLEEAATIQQAFARKYDPQAVASRRAVHRETSVLDAALEGLAGRDPQA